MTRAQACSCVDLDRTVGRKHHVLTRDLRDGFVGGFLVGLVVWGLVTAPFWMRPLDSFFAVLP